MLDSRCTWTDYSFRGKFYFPNAEIVKQCNTVWIWGLTSVSSYHDEIRDVIVAAISTSTAAVSQIVIIIVIKV